MSEFLCKSPLLNSLEIYLRSYFLATGKFTDERAGLRNHFLHNLTFNFTWTFITLVDLLKGIFLLSFLHFFSSLTNKDYLLSILVQVTEKKEIRYLPTYLIDATVHLGPVYVGLCNQEKLHKYTGWARDAVNSIIKDLQTVNLKLEWPTKWVATISEGAFDLNRMRLLFFHYYGRY